MILTDIFTYSKSKYLLSIFVLALTNSFLHPITAGYITRNEDGSLDYATAFVNSFVTWGISWNVIGLIIGGGIAAFKKRNNEPLQIRTAKSVVSTIFYIQFVFAILHIFLLIKELIFR